MEHVEGRSCGHVHVSKYHASENLVHAKQLLKQFFEFLERIAELACMVRTCPHPKPSFRPSPWLSSLAVSWHSASLAF